MQRLKICSLDSEPCRRRRCATGPSGAGASRRSRQRMWVRKLGVAWLGDAEIVVAVLLNIPRAGLAAIVVGAWPIRGREVSVPARQLIRLAGRPVGSIPVVPDVNWFQHGVLHGARTGPPPARLSAPRVRSGVAVHH